MYLKQIYTAIKEGTLVKTLSQRNFFFELKRLRKQKYRFRSRALSQRCKKTIARHFPDQAAVYSMLQKTIGDFSAFPEVIKSDTRTNIIETAERYLKHHFNILGSGEVILDPIDWHTDFKSGFRWSPGTFYLDYEQVDLNNHADVKIPRELSRCHHFLVLGQAYLLTKDERYTEEFIRQINSFIDDNPLMRSINWGCTMDVAIRAVNWTWALSLFVSSPCLKKSFLLKILASLLEHGHFIFENPEISQYPENHANHYTADLAGQIYLGVLFRDIPETQAWVQNGMREFYGAFRSQILPSGPTYERSTNYHRLVLEIFCSTFILLDKNGYDVPSDIWYRLEKMFEFVMHYIKPDGLAPIIGDQDNGRFHPFGLQTINNHRYLLTIGAILFNRPDFKEYSTSYNPECFFLLGIESQDRFDTIETNAIPLQSKRFPDAGFFIMRSADNYMFINISGKGKNCEFPFVGSTHTHSDLLSFELVARGRSFIVDPGSYLYSADPAARQLFRSTHMHNTVIVDNESQNTINLQKLWDFERNALPRLITWKSSPDLDMFCAEHTGFLRLSDPVLHRRTILFRKDIALWEITDLLTGSKKHLFEWYFHLDSGISVIVEKNRAVAISENGITITLTFTADQPFTLSKELGVISKAYGTKEQAAVLKVSMHCECPTHLSTVISLEEGSTYGQGGS